MINPIILRLLFFPPPQLTGEYRYMTSDLFRHDEKNRLLFDAMIVFDDHKNSLPCRARPGPARTCQDMPRPVTSCHNYFVFHESSKNLALPCRALPSPAAPGLTWPYLALPCLASPRQALPCLASFISSNDIKTPCHASVF